MSAADAANGRGDATSGRGEVMPVVILGGALNALSVGRTMWRAGVPVDALAGSPTESPLRFSRSCRRYIVPKSGMTTAETWSDWLTATAEPSVLLPCSDEGLEFIASRRAELEGMGHRPIEANDSVLLAMLDKGATSALADAAGVPAPATLTVRSSADFDELAEFPFPAALKPVHSHLFFRRFKPFAKGAVVENADHAIRLLKPILAESLEMLLTEVIPGADDQFASYYSYIDENGEPLLHFTKRKLRQYPTRFGLGTYHMTSWNETVADLGLRFFTSIGLRGIGNVEFKRDERDGCFKLIECNPRFTAANELVRVAGIDLAALAYARLVGGPLPAVDDYKRDVALWLPIEDIRAFRQYRADGDMTFAEWSRSLMHRQCTTLFDPRDPRPAVENWRVRAAALGRRVVRTPRPDAGGAGDDDPYS
jgi:D-aspartate ligase